MFENLVQSVSFPKRLALAFCFAPLFAGFSELSFALSRSKLLDNNYLRAEELRRQFPRSQA